MHGCWRAGYLGGGGDSEDGVRTGRGRADGGRRGGRTRAQEEWPQGSTGVCGVPVSGLAVPASGGWYRRGQGGGRGTATIKWDGQAGSVCAVLYSVEWCTVAASGLGGLCLVVWLLAVWLFGLSLCLSVWLALCLSVWHVWHVWHVWSRGSAGRSSTRTHSPVRQRSRYAIARRRYGARTLAHTSMPSSLAVVSSWSGPRLSTYVRAVLSSYVRYRPRRASSGSPNPSQQRGWCASVRRRGGGRADAIPYQGSQQPEEAKRGRGRAYRRGATPCEPRSSP